MALLRPSGDTVGAGQTNAVEGGMGDDLDETYLENSAPYPPYFNPAVDAGAIVVPDLRAPFTWSIRISMAAYEANCGGFYLFINAMLVATLADEEISADTPPQTFTATITQTDLDLLSLGDGPHTLSLDAVTFEMFNGSGVRLHDWWISTKGDPPMRQKQRDDGLGRSSVRARGGTSVQQSIRQRGYQ